MKIALLLIALLPAAGFAANRCGLPQINGAAGGTMSNGTHSVVLSVVAAGGLSQSTQATLGIGPQFISRATYRCFMELDLMLVVKAYPGSKSIRRNVPSASRSMTLEWTSSAAALQLAYSVFVGTSPFDPTNVVNDLQTDGGSGLFLNGITPASFEIDELQYLTPYYWRIVATDQFGRTAESPIYTFSIAPAVDHMIAAPNPFHPGANTTTLMFAMPGAGAASLEILSLPDARSVLKTRLDGLTDGVNTYTYDGRDANGRWLPNGVYVVRLSKNGANANETELFKLVSVR